MSATPTAAPTRARAAAIALALLVGAWLWLNLRPSAPLHEDTNRDLAFARDLVDGAVQHRHGAWASFASLEQGTAWIDFLALLQLLGLGVVGIERVLTTLLAASVALSFVGFAWLLPPGDRAEQRERGALVGALLVLGALPLVCEMPILWQPTLLPIPIVLAHLSLWRLLRDGELIDALALAVLCAIALDVHVVSAPLLLLAVAAVPLASERPLIATPLSLAAGVGTLWLSSWDAAWDNLGIMIERGWLVPALIVGGLALLGGMLARKRARALDAATRLRAALGIELGVLALVMAASLLDATPSLTGRYLSPFLPAGALAVALVTSRARTPRSSLASVVLAGCVVIASLSWLRPKPERVLPIYPEWRIAEFEPVAAELVARELSWTDLIARLQGPSTALVLGHLSSRVDPGVVDPPRADEGLLLVALELADADAVVPELPAAALTRLQLDGLDALLVRTPMRVDQLGAQLCRDGRDCVDVVLAVTSRVYQAHVSAWVDGEAAAIWLAGGGELPGEIQWKIPVRRGPAAVLMLSSVLPEHCAWHFVATEGFDAGASLPTHLLELPAEAEGALLITRRLDPGEWACAEHGLLPPAIIETEPSWTKLRELLAPPW